MAGWPSVARKLNEAMYASAKVMLGLQAGVSLGAGGHVRVFHETRLFTRVATTVLQRIVTTRARLDLLPGESVAGIACLGARAVSPSFSLHLSSLLRR